MPFIDTQILIDSLIGHSSNEIEGVSISSVTANEFLGVHGSNPVKANYYIPQMPNGVMSLLHSEMGSRLHPKRQHPFNRLRTDRIVVSFGSDFPSLIEYGSIAVAETINEKALGLFTEAISFLPKGHQKKLRRKFTFLLENGINCTAISPATVSLAQSMLYEFIKTYKLKDNFRNSWNDFLVAATALRAEEILSTKDSLLFRFTASRFGSLSAAENHQLLLAFRGVESNNSRQNLESKGFVNRGWQVKFRGGR